MAWNSQGMVLCIARDHIAIEPAHEHKCAEVNEGSACLPLEVALTRAGCQTIRECGSCVDLPLKGDTIAPLPRVHDKSQDRAFGLLAELPFSATDHQAGSTSFSAMIRLGHPDCMMVSISTSVLRI